MQISPKVMQTSPKDMQTSPKVSIQQHALKGRVFKIRIKI